MAKPACTALREKYGNIFRDVFVHLASVKYVFYVSLQSFMTCRRSFKEKVFSFISYCILCFNHSLITCAQICSLPNLLLPARLLRNSHSPIALSPRSLAPRSLLPPNHSLPDRSLAPTHPVPSRLLSNLLPDLLIDLPLISEK